MNRGYSFLLCFLSWGLAMSAGIAITTPEASPVDALVFEQIKKLVRHDAGSLVCDIDLRRAVHDSKYWIDEDEGGDALFDYAALDPADLKSRFRDAQILVRLLSHARNHMGMLP